jgi:hypothetical protein
LAIFITVLGRDSEAYSKLLNEQSRKRVQQGAADEQATHLAR